MSAPPINPRKAQLVGTKDLTLHAHLAIGLNMKERKAPPAQRKTLIATAAAYVRRYPNDSTRAIARYMAEDGVKGGNLRYQIQLCRNEVGRKSCRSEVSANHVTPRAKRDRQAAMRNIHCHTPAKILLFDIETSNLAADFGRCLCMGWMWLGDEKPHIASVRTSKAWGRDHTDDHTLVAEVQRVIKSADMLVSWYGLKFDVPFLNTRLIYYGLPLIPPSIPHVDLWRTSRYRLKLHSNRLASACDFFNLTPKTPIRGEAWVKASAGHKPSLRYVEEHCRADVLALRDAYLKLRPLVYNHPNVMLAVSEDDDGRGNCPACGSEKWVEDATHFGPVRSWIRMRCKDCGHQKSMSRQRGKR